MVLRYAVLDRFGERLLRMTPVVSARQSCQSLIVVGALRASQNTDSVPMPSEKAEEYRAELYRVLMRNTQNALVQAVLSN